MKTKTHLFFVLIAAVALSMASFSHAPAVDAAAKKPAVYVPRRIDGIYDVQSRANFHPVVAMIDNHPAARPQSGLQQASFVYETLAEGGIPRFMAVYGDYNVARIGPIRSIRPYFAQYAGEWRAAVVHAGGSPDGLKKVMEYRLLSIEGIKGKFAKFFYRAFGGGVHGLYTDSKKIIAAMKLGHVWGHQPIYQAYKFVDDAVLAARGRANSGAFINLGAGRAYDVEYRYDKKINAYRRWTGHAVQKDRLTNRQVTVKNVVIISIPKEKVLDRKGRLELKVVGKGAGVLLQNGKAVKITWQKKSVLARTIFRGPDGKEIPFVRGNTWITIVPKGHSYKLL